MAPDVVLVPETPIKTGISRLDEASSQLSPPSSPILIIYVNNETKGLLP